MVFLIRKYNFNLFNSQDVNGPYLEKRFHGQISVTTVVIRKCYILQDFLALLLCWYTFCLSKRVTAHAVFFKFDWFWNCSLNLQFHLENLVSQDGTLFKTGPGDICILCIIRWTIIEVQNQKIEVIIVILLYLSWC